ncbi:MAG: alpha/beta hydrolase [Flavobacteriaceae bacterium]|nr:alpha/beta hydrolase [Flavobacteriaceae bacterium]
MKIRFQLFLISFLCFSVLFSCTSEEEPNLTDNEISTEAVAFLDVSYGSHPDQTYDIYLPEGRSPFSTKVIVLVHGGSWIEGDKSDMTEIVTFLQQSHPNHAIVNVNYVLATPTIPAFPNQFIDLDTIINKITSEAKQLQILPIFGFIGVSAGAHLSLMYDYVYDIDDQVKFVANIVGPTNLTDPFFSSDPDYDELIAFYVDETKYPNTTNYAQAVSPAFKVSFASSPTVMFYGNQDPIVPLSNGELLDEKLSEEMITHSFTIYNGGHGDDWSETDWLNVQSQIGEYIDDYLYLE